MSSAQGWVRKFAVAIAGIFRSIRSQNSFWVHLPVAAAVIVVAAWLQVEVWRWVSLVLAITVVMSLELINTSIEQLTKALHPKHDPQIGHALDAAAGAVLVATIGAITVGLIVLGPPLWAACGLG